MDKAALGQKLLALVSATAAVASPLGWVQKVWAIATQILTFLHGLDKDMVDYCLDLIEANNSENRTVMTAMRLVRWILQCPDEADEVDQTKPI